MIALFSIYSLSLIHNTTQHNMGSVLSSSANQLADTLDNSQPETPDPDSIVEDDPVVTENGVIQVGIPDTATIVVADSCVVLMWWLDPFCSMCRLANRYRSSTNFAHTWRAAMT
jgi:hypothetical protein